MAYQITLPDGSIGLIDDSVPRNRAMEAAQAAYPDAFPGIGEQLLGAPGELLKGLGRGIVDPVTGLASTAYTGLRAAGVEMAPFAETGVGKGLAGVQEYLAPDYGTVSEFAKRVANEVMNSQIVTLPPGMDINDYYLANGIDATRKLLIGESNV